MKAKDIFLQNIKDRIKILQDAYNFNKNLPDDMFESLINGNSRLATVSKDNTEEVVQVIEKEYGANKKLLREIIANEGLPKSEIIKRFEKSSPHTENVHTVVTNALSALNNSDEVEKYKPRGKKKMRGFYWKLKKEE